MPNMLDQIIANKKLEIKSKQNTLALSDFREKLLPGNGSFFRALNNSALNVIAEIKPKSPSSGDLRVDLNIDEIVRVYDQYAAAISVLTDEVFFAGSYDLLAEVSQKSTLPTLCKDFILDPYQCYLARYSGAQAVLLIVKILDQEDLENLYKQINELAMTAVIEVQNKIELERAMALYPTPEIILINNRNLEDFKINFSTTKILSQCIEEQTIVVSASGIESKTHVEELMPFCTNFLIGSKLMRSADLESEFKQLIDIRLSLSSTGISGGINDA